MPKITENGLVMGARGNFAKQFVYKKRGGNTHIAKMPATDKKRVSTLQQSSHRSLFKRASLFARGVISDPLLKDGYKKNATGGATAFNMAFRDYLNAPTVEKINTDNYNGAVGSKIVVAAVDDFRVVKVTVTILNAAGDILETGQALLNAMNLAEWEYTAMFANTDLAGTVVRAVVFDVPGNKGSMEKTL